MYISETLHDIFTFKAFRSRNRPKNIFWALKDVSFDVEEGDTVGIIGHNGSGKTTLLRILSRVTEPSEGFAEISGRVGTLLEAAAAFHHDLTGRENIFLAGAIMGTPKAEVRRRFDEIVEFGGVKDFLDLQVKRYSSGMLVRLGFSVAACLAPEILILDEVLAVGDAAFQEKALRKIRESTRGRKATLLVSHDLQVIETLCNKSLVMNRGKGVFFGPSDQAVDHYLSLVQTNTLFDLAQRTDRQGSGRVRFTNIRVYPSRKSGSNVESVRSGSETTIELSYSAMNDTSLEKVTFSCLILNSLRSPLFLLKNTLVGKSFGKLPSSGAVQCTIPSLPLTPGHYIVNIFIEVESQLCDGLTDAAYFTVTAGDFYKTNTDAPMPSGEVLVHYDWDALG